MVICTPTSDRTTFNTTYSPHIMDSFGKLCSACLKKVYYCVCLYFEAILAVFNGGVKCPVRLVIEINVHQSTRDTFHDYLKDYFD